jgi:hypothetical protein
MRYIGILFVPLIFAAAVLIGCGQAPPLAPEQTTTTVICPTCPPRDTCQTCPPDTSCTWKETDYLYSSFDDARLDEPGSWTRIDATNTGCDKTVVIERFNVEPQGDDPVTISVWAISRQNHQRAFPAYLNGDETTSIQVHGMASIVALFDTDRNLPRNDSYDIIIVWGTSPPSAFALSVSPASTNGALCRYIDITGGHSKYECWECVR